MKLLKSLTLVLATLFLGNISIGLLHTAAQDHQRDGGSHLELVAGAFVFGIIALLCLAKAIGLVTRISAPGRRLYLYGTGLVAVVVFLLLRLFQPAPIPSPSAVNLAPADVSSTFQIVPHVDGPFNSAAVQGDVPPFAVGTPGLRLSSLSVHSGLIKAWIGADSIIISYPSAKDALGALAQYIASGEMGRPDRHLAWKDVGDNRFSSAEVDGRYETATVAFQRGPMLVILMAYGTTGAATESWGHGLAVTVDRKIERALKG